jgi:hypothetical protein
MFYGYRARWPRNQDLIFGRDKRVSLSRISRLAVGPTQPVPEFLSPRINWVGLEPDHSPESNLNVKIVWTIPVLPCTSSWHGG